MNIITDAPLLYLHNTCTGVSDFLRMSDGDHKHSLLGYAVEQGQDLISVFSIQRACRFICENNVRIDG
ncbi:hypothetical protein D3C74_485630 [compost metagenome]